MYPPHMPPSCMSLTATARAQATSIVKTYRGEQLVAANCRPMLSRPYIGHKATCTRNTSEQAKATRQSIIAAGSVTSTRRNCGLCRGKLSIHCAVTMPHVLTVMILHTHKHVETVMILHTHTRRNSHDTAHTHTTHVETAMIRHTLTRRNTVMRPLTLTHTHTYTHRNSHDATHPSMRWRNNVTLEVSLIPSN